jgi:ABC-2 type transport system ATP-binding protein
MAELVARGLRRRFGEAVPVDGVDLDLSAGEVFGLIGPNGGGKSTLLLLLAGLVAPSEGEVTVDGRATTELAMAATGTVGLVTAEPGLYPLLTGWENLTYFGGLYGLTQTQVRARATPLLDRLQLTAALDAPTARYSSGMRQKVSLARALLLSPRVLLLDEPTANLDPRASHLVHLAVREAADQGIAVALATHDLHAAEHVCDRVAVMDRQLSAPQALTGDRRAPPVGALHRLLGIEP